MIGALLALSLTQTPLGSPSRLDRLQQAMTAERQAAGLTASTVVLDCRAAAEGLTDCKLAEGVLDGAMLAEAIRMAGAITAPQALADSGDGRVMVKMNVGR